MFYHKERMRRFFIKTRNLSADDIEQLSSEPLQSRVIICPDNLLEENEWTERSETDPYEIGDGSYYDPVTNAFMGFITVPENGFHGA